MPTNPNQLPSKRDRYLNELRIAAEKFNQAIVGILANNARSASISGLAVNATNDQFKSTPLDFKTSVASNQEVLVNKVNPDDLRSQLESIYRVAGQIVDPDKLSTVSTTTTPTKVTATARITEVKPTSSADYLDLLQQARALALSDKV